MFVSPLCAAAARNRVDLVQLLLDRGADITNLSSNRPRFKTVTPLHYAIQAKNHVMVGLLLKNGHDPNYPSLNHVYPLMEAIRTDCQEIIKLFMKYQNVRVNIDYDLFGGFDFPPLYQALFKFRRYKIASILLESKRCHLVFHGDSYLSILLWNIANQCFSHLKIAQMLFEAGIDLCCKDRHHNYPFTTIVTANTRILILEQASNLLKMLVMAGLQPTVEEVCVLEKYVKNGTDQELCEWLNSIATTPLDLQIQCRKCVRSNCGLYPKDKIGQLPLPESMINYLTLSQL